MNRSLQTIGFVLKVCHQTKACYFHQQTWRRFASRFSTDLPRITVPHKTYARMQKLKQRKAADQTSKKLSFKSPLMISCKRNNFNHHRGQTYSEFGPQTLASYGWKHPKSKGDYFTLMCHDKNPALIHEDTSKSFHDLRLEEDIVNAAEALGFDTPTSIQSAAVPAILRGESTLCAAETGSGKTLAYLLPALNMLFQRKKLQGEPEEGVLNRPSIIVLLPTRELADQVTRVAESLQQYLDFTMYSVCGGRGTKGRLAWGINRPMDLLISTPGVLRKLLIAGRIKSSGLQQVILDEADTLLDDSFMDLMDRVFYRLQIPILQSSNRGNGDAGSVGEGEGDSSTGFVAGVQIVLVSATMPRGLEDSIGAYVPVSYMKKVTTAALHRLMPHVPQKFLRLLPSQKPEELLKLVKSEAGRTGNLIIFCNTGATTYFVGHLLEQNGLKPAIVNGHMPEKLRKIMFENFYRGQQDILISTDVFSRGLDTTDVRHVINYDFPNFVSDYIHRAGRVGRVGSHHSCKVTSFVSHKWEVDTLWQIEIAARKSADIHNVNANIKRKLLGDHSQRTGVPVEDLTRK